MWPLKIFGSVEDVVPAEAGIQNSKPRCILAGACPRQNGGLSLWIPAFAGSGGNHKKRGQLAIDHIILRKGGICHG